MKKAIFYLTSILIIIFVYFYREDIVKFAFNFFNKKIEVNYDQKNDYYLKYNYMFLKKQKDFKLEDKSDIFNIYYTITNNGYDNFTFYCPEEYKTCLDDLKELVFDQKTISVINDFVHPYNSFQNIRTEYNALGEVTLKIIKTYSEQDIIDINNKVQEIINNEIKDEKDPRNIIRIVHDYIINHTKYDKERADNNNIKYQSNTAYGVLFEGYGVCGGYTDTMAIFLDYFDIPNFKISSENHIWNVVYIDGQWLHLDLTWDDPIVSTGEEIVSTTYFLITTEKLREINDSQHIYDPEIYKEVAY